MTENFLMKTISERKEVLSNEGDKLYIVVTRTRTSLGYKLIKASFRGFAIEFDDDASYEAHARLFAEVILAVCNNPCELPKDQ